MHVDDSRSLFLFICKNVTKLSGIICYCIVPHTKTALSVYCLYPFLRSLSLGLNLGRLLTLCFQDQHFIILKPHKKIRPIFPYNTLKNIKDFKSKMVVFYPRGYINVSVQLKGMR